MLTTSCKRVLASTHQTSVGIRAFSALREHTDFAKSPLIQGTDGIRKSFINGKIVNSQVGAQLYSVPDPTVGGELVKCQIADENEVNEAVAAAKAAQPAWAALTGTERGRVLTRAARILEERNDEIAKVEAIDTGRPIQETEVVDIISARDCFEFYGGLASSISGSHLKMPDGSFAYTVKEPLGVTAGIGAWNYPIQGAAWKAAPSLAAGNAIIFKPAEDTPLSALCLAEALKEAGLPDGLFNVVLGPGTTGQLLSTHDDIHKVSFTGELGTGKRITRDAAENLKKVTMELGGKSPLVVFDDANLHDAVSTTMLANFYSNGEVCSNGTRVFVHESIHDKFVSELVRRTKLLKCGPALDMSSQVSALIHEQHMERVLEYVQVGIKEGATLECGGERIAPAEPGFEAGYYVSPAVFTNCTDDMTIVQEEIFGPVASILPFKTEEEVIVRSNDTKFGLAAGVFTTNLQRAHRMVSAFEAGMCYINTYNLAPVEIPWSGHKQSGVGSENGVESLNQWLQTKSVYVEMGPVECPYE